jgi:hypothetical protein
MWVGANSRWYDTDFVAQFREALAASTIINMDEFAPSQWARFSPAEGAPNLSLFAPAAFVD